MATFVLVHGAMHGGWCWHDVQRRLAQRGHDVHRPTLSGQGDRRAGLTLDVGVTTHVQDLEELLWFEDLSDVHLVLHSYAGILAGPLAERPKVGWPRSCISAPSSPLRAKTSSTSSPRSRRALPGAGGRIG